LEGIQKHAVANDIDKYIPGTRTGLDPISKTTPSWDGCLTIVASCRSKRIG
jgi:hypothetical protein